MYNLINILREHNGKVARVVLCRPSFAFLRTPTQERPTQVGSYPMVEDEMREEYQIELTDGRVVHQH